MTKILRSKAAIAENSAIRESYRLMKVVWPEAAALARPGQFAEIKAANGSLLRKPISIHDASPENGTVSFIYRIVGRGTKALSELQAGESVDILAPLGNGFELKPGRAVLVGGGVGTPPLYFLAKELMKKGVSVTVVTGARSGSDLLLQDEFKALGAKALAATDDGSTGLRGTVITALQHAAGDPDPNTALYACGPLPMLKALTSYAADKEFDLQVCMEAYMGCGLGVCVGCTIPTINGMQRVCKEGPVFNAKEVIWDKIR